MILPRAHIIHRHAVHAIAPNVCSASSTSNVDSAPPFHFRRLAHIGAASPSESDDPDPERRDGGSPRVSVSVSLVESRFESRFDERDGDGDAGGPSVAPLGVGVVRLRRRGGADMGEAAEVEGRRAVDVRRRRRGADVRRDRVDRVTVNDVSARKYHSLDDKTRSGAIDDQISSRRRPPGARASPRAPGTHPRHLASSLFPPKFARPRSSASRRSRPAR